MAAVFACTKCFNRFPFEELSSNQQLCKVCREAFPVVKCTYCRTEFQETKGSTSSACRKCEGNIKIYGKPGACQYCNIIAAFIGSKCQRCSNSEKKYGPPVSCEQCKQRCAFDRKDDSRKRVDGKLLCWLCTLSYKRALAKAKQNETSVSRHSAISHPSKSSHHHSSYSSHKRSHSHSSKSKLNLDCLLEMRDRDHGSSKKSRPEGAKSVTDTLPTSNSALLDPIISDHVVALTQLKDQIATLEKKLVQKEQMITAKDRQMSEMKAQHGVLERELRLKIQAMQKQHNEMVDDLQTKLRILQKQMVTLSKTKKRVSNANNASKLL